VTDLYRMPSHARMRRARFAAGSACEDAKRYCEIFSRHLRKRLHLRVSFQSLTHFLRRNSPFDIGWDFWTSKENALPDRTIELLKQHRLALFGAITSKPKERQKRNLFPRFAARVTSTEARSYGCGSFSISIFCIRPCISFPNNPLNFIRREGAGFVEPKVDTVIFRQNTECLYCGVEWTNPPKESASSSGNSPADEAVFEGAGRRSRSILRIFTRGACQRIVRAAFEHAKAFGYKSVTICEKPNVIRETSGMMEAEAKNISKEYPGIALWSTNIDAQMMWLTKNPEDYGVLVAGNMFGDIVSDGFAGLVGGLGFAAERKHRA